jgi:hypothetical protein
LIKIEKTNSKIGLTKNPQDIFSDYHIAKLSLLVSRLKKNVIIEEYKPELEVCRDS